MFVWPEIRNRVVDVVPGDVENADAEWQIVLPVYVQCAHISPCQTDQIIQTGMPSLHEWLQGRRLNRRPFRTAQAMAQLARAWHVSSHTCR